MSHEDEEYTESLRRHNYIIRIYRKDLNDPEKVVGLVEIIESNEQKPFSNFDELCGILSRLER